MEAETTYLNALLRLELTAVNQQFIHILALRQGGDEARASRIYDVDRIDFPNVMRLIDHLVVSGTLLPLVNEMPRPGCGLAGILTAEADIEERLQALLVDAPALSGPAQRLSDTALQPRAAYRAWLAAERRAAPPPVAEAAQIAVDPALDRLFSCLVAVLEQLMVHAFVYRHAGLGTEADIAWATSGITMVQAGELVTALAGLGTMPRPQGTGLLHISAEPREAAREDLRLLEAYALLAAAVGEGERSRPLSALCRQIAAVSGKLARWRRGEPHPAQELCTPVFRSFDTTWRKFVG